MRRLLLVSALFAAACGDAPIYESDARPIQLAHAPVSSGGAAQGALLAKFRAGASTPWLLVDTGYTMSGLNPGACPMAEPRAHTDTLEVLDAVLPTAPLRAVFRDVRLWDLCAGPAGDANTQVGGVLGNDLLSHYSLALRLPSDAGQSPTMTLYTTLPASESRLAEDGYAVIGFLSRGSAELVSASGAGLGSVSGTRPVVRTCAAPREFASDEVEEICEKGEANLRASGANLLLGISTGHGPLVLSASAWARITGQAAVAPDGSEPPLYSPLVSEPVPAHWVTLPRLALMDRGDSDDDWPGACVELARSRRIEWTLANQATGACYQPCDSDGSLARTSLAYLELGGALAAAVVSDTSDLMRTLNVDVPPGAQIDGLIGAAALAGTRLEIDYPSGPDGRLTAVCESGADRKACYAAPRCPRLSGSGQSHACFGLPPQSELAPVCPK